MGPKTLPTIWGTYMKLVTKKFRFLPSTVTEKNVTKNILDGRKDGQTDRGKTVYPPSNKCSSSSTTSQLHCLHILFSTAVFGIVYLPLSISSDMKHIGLNKFIWLLSNEDRDICKNLANFIATCLSIRDLSDK
jgi:hypothetical protein